MGTPCNCCGGSTEPREACDTSGENIPDHPSSPSARVLTAGQSLTIETLAVGCSITATIGDSTIGRHALNISITSNQPLWHGFAIVWLNHADLPLDPHVIGSLGTLAAGASLKISDVSGWDVSERPLPVSDRSGPWLIPTLVIEQGGKLFLAYRRRLLDLTLAAPCCWRGISANALDAGKVDRMTRSVFEIDRSSAGESVVSGNGLQCSDAFGALRADGTLDRDDRPNFNLGLTSHPITRVGFAVGFTSCPWEVSQENWGGEGTFELKGLLGPICGVIESYGSYYTAGDATTPEPPGTLLIDEPLDAVPSEWAAGDLLIDDGLAAPLRAEGSHAGAIFTARDGFTVVENVGLSEYPSGTLFTDLPHARSEWVDGSKLTIEFTWRRVRDADRRYDLPGTPAPSEYRNQSCGVFIGGLLRIIFRHEHAQRYDQAQSGGGITPAYGWIANAPVHAAGGSINAAPGYTPWPDEWSYDPPQPALPQGAAWQVAGEPAFDARGQRAPIAVNDGDQVAIVLSLSRPTIRNPYDNGGGYASPTIVDYVWSPQVWVNGRKIGGLTVGGSSGVLTSFRAVPPLTTLRLGLVAYYGGGWGNFKAWLA